MGIPNRRYENKHKKRLLFKTINTSLVKVYVQEAKNNC